MKPDKIIVATKTILKSRLKDTIVLVKSKHWNGLFTLPGGTVNPNETIFEASQREVKEEVSGAQIDVDTFKIKNYCQIVNTSFYYKPIHAIVFLSTVYVLGEIDTLKRSIEEKEEMEIDEVRLVSRKNIVTMKNLIEPYSLRFICEDYNI